MMKKPMEHDVMMMMTMTQDDTPTRDPAITGRRQRHDERPDEDDDDDDDDEDTEDVDRISWIRIMQ
jgi:hypothetical protein